MEIFLVGLIQRYIVQALDQLLPNLPAYAKLAAAAILSAASSLLGAVHAPSQVLQALPGAGSLVGAILVWAATDAIHGVLNFVEKKAKA